MGEPSSWHYHTFSTDEEWQVGMLSNGHFECRIREGAKADSAFEQTQATSPEIAVQWFARGRLMAEPIAQRFIANAAKGR